MSIHHLFPLITATHFEPATPLEVQTVFDPMSDESFYALPATNTATTMSASTVNNMMVSMIYPIPTGNGSNLAAYNNIINIQMCDKNTVPGTTIDATLSQSGTFINITNDKTCNRTESHTTTSLYLDATNDTAITLPIPNQPTVLATTASASGSGTDSLSDYKELPPSINNDSETTMLAPLEIIIDDTQASVKPNTILSGTLLAPTLAPCTPERPRR